MVGMSGVHGQRLITFSMYRDFDNEVLLYAVGVYLMCVIVHLNVWALG